MKIVPVLILLLPLKVLAGTVLYTDSAHPPVNLSVDSKVVYLDGPQTLTDAMTGTLPANPQQAEAMARQMMRSPAWREKDQQLRQAYLNVMHAWELGLKKYPAVVFDDKEVVYGTADIAQAQAIVARGGQS